MKVHCWTSQQWHPAFSQVGCGELSEPHLSRLDLESRVPVRRFSLGTRNHRILRYHSKRIQRSTAQGDSVEEGHAGGFNEGYCEGSRSTPDADLRRGLLFFAATPC